MSLQKLSISTCGNLTSEGIGHIIYITSLKKLRLFGLDVRLINMNNLKLLEKLNLKCCTLNGLVFNGLKFLRTLDLSETLVLDDDLEQLSHLSSLMHLDLSKCYHFTGRGLNSLTSLPLFESLYLDHCFSHHQPDSSAPSALNQLTKLKKLSLEEVKNIDPILQSIKCERLEVLDLRGITLSKEVLNSVITLPNLKILYIISSSEIASIFKDHKIQVVSKKSSGLKKKVL